MPTFEKTNIAVMFIPGKSVLIDRENHCYALGYAMQSEDGQFCIPDVGNAAHVIPTKGDRKHVLAIQCDLCTKEKFHNRFAGPRQTLSISVQYILAPRHDRDKFRSRL